MVVTVNTDASFSPHHKVGAYAAWIKFDNTKLTISGELRAKCNRPEEAEYKCIINALAMLSRITPPRRIRKIIINTDCLNVIHCATGDKKAVGMYNLRKLDKAMTPEYKKILSKFPGVEMDFRHVKSHQSTDTPREFVNQWCDTEAKKHLTTRIEKAKKQQQKNNQSHDHSPNNTGTNALHRRPAGAVRHPKRGKE